MISILNKINKHLNELKIQSLKSVRTGDYRIGLSKAIDVVNSEIHYLKKQPTAFEKNNLPLKTRYSYNKGIELYQKIQSYEMGIIDKNDFINEVEAIEDKYNNLLKDN